MVEQITAQVISIKDIIKYCNEPLTDFSFLDRHNYTGKSSHKDDYENSLWTTIYNNEINFKTPFFLIDKLSSKVILGNPFLALLDPFFTIDKGICTNILEIEVFFKLLLPPIPKDICLLKEISISKDISTDKIELVIDDEIPTNLTVENTILPSSSST